jgi:hypothetical protein
MPIPCEIIESVAKSITAVTAIIGVVISVVSYKAAKEKEAVSRKIEAAKSFLELRQKLYLEALSLASILASKSLHTEEEVAKAKKRFAELYWGELSLIEAPEIEEKMIAVAKAEGLFNKPDSTQIATYNLAHSMRESLVKSWGMDNDSIEKTNS